MSTQQKINSLISPINHFVRALGWLAIFGLVGVLLGLLTLPLEVRDLLILGLAVFAVILSIRNFGIAWLIFIICLPLIYLMVGMFGQSKINGLRIFLVLLAGIFLVLPKPKRFWFLLFRNPTFWGLILFWGANLVSGIISGELEAIFRALTYLEPLTFFLLSYFIVLRQPQNWRMLLWAIGVSGAYVFLLGLLELVMQKPLAEILGFKHMVYNVERLQFYFTEDRFGLGGRISSVLLQPVYAGLFFSVLAILLTYYIAAYRKRFRGWLFFLLPLSLGMTILTGSRGPLLALGVALLAFVAFNQRKGFTFVITVIGLGMLGFVILNFIPGIRTYMQASFDPTQQASGNFTQRINLTLMLFNFFKANPIFGYGPGLIQKAAQQGVFGFAGLAGLENQYAVILADGGLLAGVTYLVFIYGVFALAVRAYRSENQELQAAGTMMLVLAAYFFAVVISVNGITAVAGYLFVTIVGSLAGLYDHHLHYMNRIRK
jgi:hypothetical protein